MVPIVCIRVSFAIKPSPFSLLSVGDSGYENFPIKMRTVSFYIKIDLKTNEYPTIHKIRSDDSLHMSDNSHYIHTHSIISFFPCTVNFSFRRDYQER